MTLMLHALQVPRGQRKLHLEGYDRYTDSIASARIFYEQMEASMPDETRNQTRTNFVLIPQGKLTSCGSSKVKKP